MYNKFVEKMKKNGKVPHVGHKIFPTVVDIKYSDDVETRIIFKIMNKFMREYVIFLVGDRGWNSSNLKTF